MMIIGLLLVAAAVVVGTGVVIGNTESSTNLDIFGLEVANASGTGVFLLGAASAAVLLIGLWMIAAGLRKSRSRRLEVKQARHDRDKALRQQEDERRALAAERERLADEKARMAGENDRRVVRPERTAPSDSADTRVVPRADTSASNDRPVKS